MVRKNVAIGAIVLALTLLTSPVLAAGLFTDWLFYETWDSFDWTYSPDNAPGSAFTVDGDANLVVDTYGTPRLVLAEKQLECAISPNADFVLEAHLIVETDPASAAGDMAVELHTEDGLVAAYIAWYDWQAAAGFGSIEMGAEGGGANTIYRSEPHGASPEFATINHVARVVRVGDEWSAWIDEKKGATLVFQPTMTITKVKIRMAGDVPPWTPRETKMDYVKVVNSPVFGDANCSGAVDIDDVVYVITYIFSGGPPPCGCVDL